jgi:stearoyl-CoA desaturase (delta-9 desaturase)
MNVHWKRFKNDKYYLIKYFTVTLLCLSIILGFQIYLTNFQTFFQLKHLGLGLALFPLGLILGVKAPVLIHNCVHGNLKNSFLNQAAGELAGLYVWLGMAAFEINHRMHHVHSDSDLDPHNPKNKKFYRFFFANNFGGTKPVLNKYLQYHGDTQKNRNLFKFILFLHFIGVPLRMTFWILLLGPGLFLSFFLPSYLFHMFVFAHINFVTHETRNDGTVKIFNLDSNVYYKFVNFFGNGVYFHKNHHDNPNFYNPQQKLAQSRFLY